MSRRMYSKSRQKWHYVWCSDNTEYSVAIDNRNIETGVAHYITRNMVSLLAGFAMCEEHT